MQGVLEALMKGPASRHLRRKGEVRRVARNQRGLKEKQYEQSEEKCQGLTKERSV
jgi:hypothetical protein